MEDAKKTPGFLHLHALKDGAQWLHMCIRHKETSTYLMDVAMLDDLVVDALVEEDTRSRVRVSETGIMVLLKAMHVSQDMASPEDMVSIRVWIDHARVITTREADVDPIIVLHARLDEGKGPATPGEFLADLIEEHLDEVDEHIEALEDLSIGSTKWSTTIKPKRPARTWLRLRRASVVSCGTSAHKGRSWNSCRGVIMSCSVNATEPASMTGSISCCDILKHCKTFVTGSIF